MFSTYLSLRSPARLFRVLAICGLWLGSTGAHAAQAWVQDQIERTLVSTELYGGCMVRLQSTQLAPLGLNCPDRWVTFSCTGDLQPKDVAARMFDSAQLAIALNRNFRVLVTDQMKHNGYCFGKRVHVLR